MPTHNAADVQLVPFTQEQADEFGLDATQIAPKQAIALRLDDAEGRAAEFRTTPWFSDGCPDEVWQDGQPLEPHLFTACPECIESWLSDYEALANGDPLPEWIVDRPVDEVIVYREVDDAIVEGKS